MMSAKFHFLGIFVLGTVTLTAFGLCATEEKSEVDIGELMSDYVTKLHRLRTEVSALRRLLVEELKQAQVVANASCISYPYQPSTSDPARLKDDIKTLKKLLPLAMNIVIFEANDRNSSELFTFLVNQTVDSLEEVVDDFDDINKALSQNEDGSIPPTEEPETNPSAGRCSQVNSVFDEYQATMELYIAVTYAEYDAVELSNYYNSPA